MSSKILNKAVIAALYRLQDRDGRIDKYKVELEARTNPNSPLRSHFTWDKDKAAFERRLDQAAELIRLVSFKIKDSTERFVVAPIYVRDPTKGPSEAGHINVANAAEDPEIAQGVLDDALASIEELVVRHKLLGKLLNMDDELNKIIRAVQAARKSAKKAGKRKAKHAQAEARL